jgi:hypothetical protein
MTNGSDPLQFNEVKKEGRKEGRKEERKIQGC